MDITLSAKKDIIATKAVTVNSDKIEVRSITDIPSEKKIWGELVIGKEKVNLVLWEGSEYDSITNWKTSIDAKIKSLF